MVWKMKKRNKVNIFMQFACLSLATSPFAFDLYSVNSGILSLK